MPALVQFVEVGANLVLGEACVSHPGHAVSQHFVRAIRVLLEEVPKHAPSPKSRASAAEGHVANSHSSVVMSMHLLAPKFDTVCSATTCSINHCLELCNRLLYNFVVAHGHRHHGRHSGRSRRRDPRVARTRATVLGAARRLLVEEGADAVTALRISEETGIARTTIYRHWPDRENLLRDTIASEESEPEIELTGDARADLIALLVFMSEQIGKRRGARIMAVALDRSGLRGEAGGPHREMVNRRMDPLREVVVAAIAAGDLPGDLDVDGAVASLAGPLFFRAVFMRQEATPTFIEGVVDSFLAAHSG